MDGIAVGMDCSATNSAIFIFNVMRLLGRKRSPLHRFRERLVGISHLERNIAHTIAVFADMIRGLVIRRQGCGKKKIRLPLAKRVGRSFPLTGLETAVRNLRKAEPLTIEIGGLTGVSNEKFDVMDALEFERVLHTLLPVYLRILSSGGASPSSHQNCWAGRNHYGAQIIGLQSRPIHLHASPSLDSSQRQDDSSNRKKIHFRRSRAKTCNRKHASCRSSCR